MSRPVVPEDLSGAFLGSMVAVAFGLVFVVANSGELPTGWSVAVRTAGVLVALALVVAWLRVRRTGTRTPGPPPARRALGRRYWTVVAVEVAALVLGLVVVNGVLGAPQYAVAWVAVVVGLHFLPFATMWWPVGFTVLGAVMTALGVLGAVVGFLGGSAAAIGLVAGVGCGLALYAAAGVSLTRVRRSAG